MENDSNRDRGVALLNRMLGEQRASDARAGWEQICPDFEKYVVEFLSGDIWSRPGLDLKSKSLCTISALIALGRWRGVELNMEMALNNGVSETELTEALLQIAPYAGFTAA